MSTIQTAQASLGACLCVHLFKVDVDQFQLLAKSRAPVGTANTSIALTN